MNKRKLRIFLFKTMTIFWIFLIGSIFGFFIEMLYVFVRSGNLEIRQGLIYGPFIQIYGMGAVAYYLLAEKIRDPKKVFFVGMLMGGVIEYLCSFFQEILFGSISWDYSMFNLNLNGRICLSYCVYWGIIALIFLKFFYPCFRKMNKYLNKKFVKFITVFLMIFMLYDVAISWMATKRQEQRRYDIPASNVLEQYLDEKYPDECLDRIYNNKIEIIKEEKST